MKPSTIKTLKEKLLTLAGTALLFGIYFGGLLFENLPEGMKKPAMQGATGAMLSLVIFLGYYFLKDQKPFTPPYDFDNKRGFYFDGEGRQICAKCLKADEYASLLALEPGGYRCLKCGTEYREKV